MNTRTKRTAPKSAGASAPKTASKTATVVEILPPAERHDSWTVDKQVGFLRELAAAHNVSAAARAVGMSRQSAYKLRARLKGQPFDMAWDAAFQSAFDELAEAAMERALNGIEVPHYHQGELVGTSRRFDERLTIALLGSRERFLRAPAPPMHESSSYEAEDFRALLKRVELGPETWDGDEHDEVEGWEEADEGKMDR